MAPDGSFVVVYRNPEDIKPSGSGSGYFITPVLYGQRYDALGRKQGDLFRVDEGDAAQVAFVSDGRHSTASLVRRSERDSA